MDFTAREKELIINAIYHTLTDMHRVNTECDEYKGKYSLLIVQYIDLLAKMTGDDPCFLALQFAIDDISKKLKGGN